MYGLIALYIGFSIYLLFFFSFKKKDKIAKKITILLAIKLIFLTGLYFIFFSNKFTKIEKQNNFEEIIFSK